MADAPRKVNFARVTNPRVRAPSWMPSARGRAARQKRRAAAFAQAAAACRANSWTRSAKSSSPSARRVRRALRRCRRACHRCRRPLPLPSFAAEPGPVQLIVDPEATHAFEQAIELLVAERSRVLEQTASQLGELATIIARRVIAHEISLNPNIVAGLVNEGLAALGAHDRVLVRIGSAFARGAREPRAAPGRPRRARRSSSGRRPCRSTAAWSRPSSVASTNRSNRAFRRCSKRCGRNRTPPAGESR